MLFNKLSQKLGITREFLLKTRRTPYTWYKQIIMSILAEEGKSVYQIADETGKDRTTVLHNIDRGKEIRAEKRDNVFINVVKKLSDFLDIDCSIK